MSQTLVPHVSNAAQSAVRAQFVDRPRLRSVVAQRLRSSLLEKYPPLTLPVDQLRLAIPRDSGGRELYPLLEVALQYLADGTYPDLSTRNNLDGYLSDATGTRLTYTLTVAKPYDLNVVEAVIRELQWLVYIDFQDALAQFWGQPDAPAISHWSWLSGLLQSNLRDAAIRHSPTDEALLRGLTAITDCPDRQSRLALPWPDNGVHAYTLESTVTWAGHSVSVQACDILVTAANRVWLCRFSGEIEPYASLDDFGKAWGERLQQHYLADAITWRQYEPDGSIFDNQAALALNQQLEDLAQTTLPARCSVAQLEQHFADITDPAPLFDAALSPIRAMSVLATGLPDWLKDASPADRFAYRQCLLEEASAKQLANGDSYLNGLDNIKDFAKKALNKQLCLGYMKAHAPQGSELSQMCADGALPSSYAADKLQVNFKVPYGDLRGGFVESVSMGLIDLALKNLSGKPKGTMTVSHGNGEVLEAWLTPEYLLDIVQVVDIGKTYPDYIRTHLMGESPEAQRRQQLFAQLQPALLSTQATEYRIRGLHGFTARGLQLIKAVFKPVRAQRWVQDDEIVMRPLAFQRKPGATADVVQNMFIIETRNTKRGPHLLYRPSYQAQLIQFETRDALLAMIATPGALQESVLAWLSDGARGIYSNGGFLEPHYVRIGIGSEFDMLPPVPKPATLASVDDSSADELLQFLQSGKLMQFLYGSEVCTLLNQAEADSTANTESRWALILEGLEIGFNTVLTVARGPIAIVGWMLQLAMSLKKDIPALESADPITRELAWVDVLLNIGMLLLHMGQHSEIAPPANSDATRVLVLEPLRRKASSPLTPAPVIKRGTVGVASEPPGDGKTPLDFDRSFSGDSAAGVALEKLLAISVPWPVPLPEPISIGLYEGLYRIGTRWYASVGGLFFAAKIVPGFGEVFIIDPNRRERPGIKLQSLGRGRWILDRGPKLLGGGPKRIQAARQRLQATRDRLTNRLAELTTEFSALSQPHDQLSEGLKDANKTMETEYKKLNETWQLLQNSTETNRRFLTEWHAQAKLRRQNASTQFKGFLDTFRDSLPRTTELVQDICTVLKDLANAGVETPGREQQLRLIWQDLNLMREMLNSRTGDLSFSSDGERMQDLIKRVYPADRALVDSNARAEYQANTLELFNTWNQETTFASDMESLLEQLDNYSKAGQALRHTLLATIDPPRFFSANVKLKATRILLILGVDMGVEPQSPQEAQALEHLDRTDLYKVMSTHIEVRSSDGYSLTEEREVYQTLISKYRRYEGAISALVDIHSESMKSPYSDRLLQRLHEARAMAESELEDVVRKQEKLEVKLRPPITRKTKKATKRVFKTRKKEFLIGDIQPAEGENAHDHIIITDAANGDTIASYEANEDGWSDPADTRQTQPAPLQEESLPTLRDQGNRLVQQRSDIEHWVRSQLLKLDSPLTREDVNPADWSALLTNHADELAAIADALQQHHPGSQTAAKLIEDYRAHARDISRWAEQVCGDAYKRQLPSMEGLQYLWDHQQIDINLTSRADPQRPTLSGDFFTEYAVYDKAAKPPKVLWYAHFHYASADADAVCTRAHLKLPEQRKYTQKDLLKVHAQAGAEPLGKIIYVLITEPQDQLFLAIAHT